MDPSSDEHLTAVENGTVVKSTENSACASISTAALHRFHKMIMDSVIFYEVIKLRNGLYIWIGDSEGSMKDLAFSITTSYDIGKPRATKILNLSGETESESLASKLSKKLKKPVYVSFNVVVGVTGEKFVQDIQLRLFEEISIFPEKF